MVGKELKKWENLKNKLISILISRHGSFAKNLKVKVKPLHFNIKIKDKLSYKEMKKMLKLFKREEIFISDDGVATLHFIDEEEFMRYVAIYNFATDKIRTTIKVDVDYSNMK